MKQSIKHLLSISIILVISLQNLSAQNNCNSETITQAQQAYQDGNLIEARNLLSDCVLRDLFINKDDKISALELLVLIEYLDNGEIINPLVETRFKLLLSEEPEYEPDLQLDSVNIFSIYNSFRTYPILYFYASAGTNLNKPLILQRYGSDGTDQGTEEYGFLPGIQIQGGIDIPLSTQKTKEFLRKINLSLEVQYSRRGYSYTRSLQNSTSSGFNFSTLEFQEWQNWLSAPILLKYNGIQRKRIWNWFLYAGVSADYLFRASINDLSRVSPGTLTPIKSIEEDGPRSILSKRENLNFSIVGGGGLKYKLGKGWIFGDLRLSAGLKNITTTENRYGTNELSDLYTLYGYIDNDFRMNTYSLTFGYVWTIYSPKLWSKNKTK